MARRKKQEEQKDSWLTRVANGTIMGVLTGAAGLASAATVLTGWPVVGAAVAGGLYGVLGGAGVLPFPNKAQVGLAIGVVAGSIAAFVTGGLGAAVAAGAIAGIGSAGLASVSEGFAHTLENALRRPMKFLATGLGVALSVLGGKNFSTHIMNPTTTTLSNPGKLVDQILGAYSGYEEVSDVIEKEFVRRNLKPKAIAESAQTEVSGYSDVLDFVRKSTGGINVPDEKIYEMLQRAQRFVKEPQDVAALTALYTIASQFGDRMNAGRWAVEKMAEAQGREVNEVLQDLLGKEFFDWAKAFDPSLEDNVDFNVLDRGGAIDPDKFDTSMQRSSVLRMVGVWFNYDAARATFESIEFIGDSQNPREERLVVARMIPEGDLLAAKLAIAEVARLDDVKIKATDSATIDPEQRIRELGRFYQEWRQMTSYERESATFAAMLAAEYFESKATDKELPISDPLINETAPLIREQLKNADDVIGRLMNVRRSTKPLGQAPTENPETSTKHASARHSHDSHADRIASSDRGTAGRRMG